MNIFANLSLRTKLLALSGISASLALVLACFAFTMTDIRVLNEAKQRLLKAQAEMLAFNCSATLLMHDTAAATSLLEPLQYQTTLARAALYDEEGKLVASYHQPESTPCSNEAPIWRGHRSIKSESLEYALDVREGGQQVGTLYLCANMNDLQAQLTEYRTLAAKGPCRSIRPNKLWQAEVGEVV